MEKSILMIFQNTELQNQKLLISETGQTLAGRDIAGASKSELTSRKVNLLGVLKCDHTFARRLLKVLDDCI